MSEQGGSNNGGGAPLLGFLVGESDSEIRVRVAGGTWLIDRSDVESMDDWDDPVSVDFEGRPVRVTARSGATLGFLQSMTIESSDRPLTRLKRASTLFGAEHLEGLSKTWGAQHEFADDQVTLEAGGSPSVCEREDPSGFGMILFPCDCKD